MKKYLSFFRIRFSAGLQYRTAALAGVATQFAWGFMEILMFSAFYRASPQDFPMEFSQLSSYIWLQQAFLALFMTWFIDGDTIAGITNGNIAYELSRPMDLYMMWFTKDVATRTSKALLRCFPILLVAVFLPNPYGISAPANALHFVLFLITMVLGTCTVISFGMLIYIATFYTMSPRGVLMIAVSATEIFTGAIVPIPFLPNGFRQVAEILPFASMQNLPLRIYSSNIAGTELLTSMALQIFWLCALVLLGRLWISRAVKRVVIQGG